ncbi:MAG: amidohydrolase family protein, partial [Proteobacteria bacterium]|nr:amidohydrolase family protein [Pseudomonadota bacterium]
MLRTAAGCGLVVAAYAGAALAAGEEPVPADLVLTEARIYTADAARSMAEAMAVRDGRIVYVGGKAGARAFIGPATKVEALGGRLVLPGLIDSHVHADEMVRLDVCDLKNQPKSLAEITAFVQECIRHYHVAAGDWVVVRHWNYSYGNQPDAAHPTLRAALDLATTASPVHLDGDDGHHSAFNSLALARARNAAGAVVGYTRTSLRGDLRQYQRLVGVDVAGEPNGTVNDDGRNPIDVPSTFSLDLATLMKDPGRVTALLNSAGITGILDPRVTPEALVLYDTLEQRGLLSVRAHVALYFDPESVQTPAGQPDWDRMVSTATALRARYAHDPLIRADTVKIFADGDMEGNPHAVPPTLPQVAALQPYLQPIFTTAADGRLTVSGYVDTASPLCVEARAHPEQYDTPAGAAAFLAAHGYHPGQCTISSGQLQDDRAVILELVRRFHQAGFAVHIHTIGPVAVRTAIDAIEAARAADGVATQHDALAHVQLA